MSLKHKTWILLLPIVFCSVMFLSGCGKPDQAKKGIIAYVNKEPIFSSDLEREIALKVRQDPAFKVTPKTEAEQLDTIINRKLIIQKAMERGLARENRFVNTIKAYWEQTLIRDFLEYKDREFQQYLFVTEDEARDYYNKLAAKGQTEPFGVMEPEIKKTIAAGKAEKLFGDWLDKEKKKARIRIIR